MTLQLYGNEIDTTFDESLIDEFVEDVLQVLSNDFYYQNENWILDYTGNEFGEIAEKLYHKEHTKEDAARIIERWHRIKYPVD